MTDVSRRKIVTALGVGATVSLAGCNGNQDNNNNGSDGSDGSDNSGGSDGSDGEEGSSSTDLPDGFTETGVDELQTALGEGSAFYNETVIEANFTISQGQASIENYHYANHDEQVLYQTQTAPARSRENYYRDGTYYVYTSAEGVDPRYSVEEIDWQRSVVYYYPPTSLLTDGELTLEETEDGFRYVTEDVANASLLSQISQLASQSQSGSDGEGSSDPVSEFSAELSFTSEGVPTGFSYTITTESGVEETGEASYSYETTEVTEPSWVSEAEAQASSGDESSDGSSDSGSGDSSTSDGSTSDGSTSDGSSTDDGSSSDGSSSSSS